MRLIHSTSPDTVVERMKPASTHDLDSVFCYLFCKVIKLSEGIVVNLIVDQWVSQPSKNQYIPPPSLLPCLLNVIYNPMVLLRYHNTLYACMCDSWVMQKF